MNARDPRFDGLFFVGITTTGIYCRPVCPARVSYTDRRRFFVSAAAAEQAGFRPCLRCRPELAPGRALVDAVSRLARAAAQRIAAGALNGHSVTDLAGELGVSERHLRRALERELGVSPTELAQSHRLLLAKRLLADTSLSVTRIAFASGFQSLRRFNSVFLESYRLSTGAVRRAPRAGKSRLAMPPSPGCELVRLTLAYRPPLAWDLLLDALAREALPGVDVIKGGSYVRSVSLAGRTGVVSAENAGVRVNGHFPERTHLLIGISPSLLDVLMPLLARLRHLFDLDAEPTVVDAHLAEGGLGQLVKERPGLRMPGALEGFEAVLRTLLHVPGESCETARTVVMALGEPVETGMPGLTRQLPTARRVAEAGTEALARGGMTRRSAELLTGIARRMADATLRLEPGDDPAATRRALMAIEGMSDRLATAIVMRALYWPDAFPTSDPGLLRATGLSNSFGLRVLAERWRPWRAYAAIHLWTAERQLPKEPWRAESARAR